MQQDIFSAGIAPGSPTTENEIKTLLCFLLAETPEPLTFEQIHEALREHNLVNYFELIGTIDALVESGHLLISQKGEKTFYEVTDLGTRTAATLDDSLPLSVREKAKAAVALIVARRNRLEEINAKIISLETGGYQVELSIPEGKTHLISFSVYAPTRTEAEKLRKGFLNDPVFLYQGVMALLSGDLSVLGDLRPTEHPLF